MTSGSVTAAMTRNLPPHLGQRSISILNTRLSDTSHGAQPRKAEPDDDRFLDLYLEWVRFSMGRVLTFSLYPSIGRRHHEIAVLGVWCEYAMVTGEIGPGFGDESRQLSQKLQRLEDKVGGAVSEWVFEFLNDASIRLGGQPIER